MVAAWVRACELALGERKKTVTPSEAKNKTAARKSIVGRWPSDEGAVFSPKKTWRVKRTGDGISPMRWRDVLGGRPGGILPGGAIEL